MEDHAEMPIYLLCSLPSLLLYSGVITPREGVEKKKEEEKRREGGREGWRRTDRDGDEERMRPER